MTASAQDWYLRGEIASKTNSWSASTDIAMPFSFGTSNASRASSVQRISHSSDQREFKVISVNGSNTTWYGHGSSGNKTTVSPSTGYTLSTSGENMIEKLSGDYIFQINTSNNAFGAYPVNKWVVRGDVKGSTNSWSESTDIVLTKESSSSTTWKSGEVTVTAGQKELKLMATTAGGGAAWYGSPNATAMTVGSAKSTDGGVSSQNIKVTLEEGSYVFTVNTAYITSPTITITKLDTDVVKMATSLANNTTFDVPTKDITLTPSGAVKSWWYQIGSGLKVSVNGSAARTFAIGDKVTPTSAGTSIVVKWGIVSSKTGAETTGSYTYKKKITDWDSYCGAWNGNYYLYGDINRWTMLGEETRDNNGSTTQHTYFNRTTGEPKELHEVYQGTGDQALTEESSHYHDKYASPYDLMKYWKFEPCAAPAGQSGTGWYKLDLSKVPSTDGKHVGRMCGQFKIIDGWTGGKDGTHNTFHEWVSDWNTTSSTDYYNNTVKIGQVFNTKSPGDRTTHLNMHMNVNYVDNCVIYFQPNHDSYDNSGKVLITGDTDANANRIYLYYLNTEKKGKPASFTLSTKGSQFNYDVDQRNFTLSNMQLVPSGQTFTAPNGQTYTAADGLYRIALPASTEHRSPIEYYLEAKGTGAGGEAGQTVFTEIRCDDIWLIESSVNVYFSTCDIQLEKLGKFTYNIYRDQLNEAGFVVGKEWRWSTPQDLEATTETTEDGSVIFKGVSPVNGMWASGSHLVVYDAFGNQYPVDANSANFSDATLKGVDIHFKVCNDEAFDAEILYTHLKGTYDLAKEHADGTHPLQIEAELFEDGVLNTSYEGDVTYKFTVMDNAGNKVVDGKAQSAPFMSWAPTTPGTYAVCVTATKLATGETAVKTDSYPVYGAATETPVANDEFPYVIYYQNTGNWNKVCAKVFYQLANNEAQDFTGAGNGNTVTEKVTINGTEYYKVVIPENLRSDFHPERAMVVFSNGYWNGDNQSADFKYVPNARYTKTGVTHVSPNKVTVYFDNTSKKWSTVRIYYYDAIDENISWDQSVNMTKVGSTNIWKGEISAKARNVIFRDNSSQVGGDGVWNFRAIAGGLYDENGFKSYRDNDQYECQREAVANAAMAANVNDAAVNGEADPELYVPHFTPVAAAKNSGYAYLLQVDEPGNGMGHTLNYSWAKFENDGGAYETVQYTDANGNILDIHDLNDDKEIATNHSLTHKAKNFNPAYYRIYVTSTAKNMKKVGGAGNANVEHASRIARTIPVPNDNSTTGVSNIAADNADTDAPVHFYNLNGVELSVDALTPGLYIRRQGNTVTKVIIK